MVNSQDPDIKLSGTSYAVLGLVQFIGTATPYDLKRAIESSVENFWPVPHTTFYAEPTRLARAGYLVERQEATGRRRKLYEITPRGRDALEKWLASTEISPPQMRDEGLLKLFFGAAPAPMYAGRIGWHREKLVELEGYLELVSEATPGGSELPIGRNLSRESLDAVRLSLVAGITYHRLFVELLERFLAPSER